MLRTSRVGLVHLALLGFALALIVRAGYIQLWQGAAWAARADRQHVSAAEIPAPRGRILDAHGIVLAENRELVRLRVAPRELRDRAALRRALTAAGVSARWVARATDPRRAWVEVPGQYQPTDVAPAVAMRGVYASPVSERLYASSDGVRRLVGHARPDGRAVDGLELALDSVLEGRSGRATMLRDARGRRFESPTTPGLAPRPGSTVILTLNYELQEIADRALAVAVDQMDASGGDIVVLDPHSGAVLAVASRRRNDRGRASTALTEPYEPGSTIKPFIAAALIELGRVRPDEKIDTHGGRYEAFGRTIRDEHPAGALTLPEIIGHSSNVGIVRLAERLAPGEQYQALRDFGFGAPTGIPYPSEAGGTLRPPSGWSKQSAASLAMGYEIAATPLQLALAYAAIANGGELLEPMLVKEIRSADGDLEYRARRRVVRRVVSEEVAAEVRRMLVGVVRDGTGREAELRNFTVGGKTGTSQRLAGGSYSRSEYDASFVGIFPAEDPQYVIAVKLAKPEGDFGGKTAAPVSKVVVQAALAARDAALDRDALSRAAIAPAPLADSMRLAMADEAPAVATRRGTVPVVIALDAPSAARAAAVRARRVPDVRGLPLRAAVHRLHRAGFRVRLATGPAGQTSPAAGASAPPGSTVRLFRRR